MHRAKATYSQIKEFEAHTGNGGDPDTGEEVNDDDTDLAKIIDQLDGVRAAGKNVGKLNAKTIEKWHRLGWFILFDLRCAVYRTFFQYNLLITIRSYGHHPNVKRTFVRHSGGKLSDVESIAGDTQSDDNNDMASDGKLVQSNNPTNLATSQRPITTIDPVLQGFFKSQEKYIQMKTETNKFNMKLAEDHFRYEAEEREE